MAQPDSPGTADGAIVVVRMGALEVGRAPAVLTTYGLGSCLGLAVWDPVSRVGGLAHIMLPDSRLSKVPDSPVGKFADTAIPALLARLREVGGDPARCRVKMVGAASMFAGALDPSRLVGPRNVDAARRILSESGIAVDAEETGGTVGRTVELHTDTGALRVRTVRQGTKEL